jgi:hypothetical protein
MWGPWPDFFYYLLFVDMGSPLWWEDGPVVYNCCWASPAQLFSVRIPLDLSPYFTVSDWWLLQPGGSRSSYLYPPKTGWPSYAIRHWLVLSALKLNFWLPTFSRPLSWCRAPIWGSWQVLLSDNWWFLSVGCPLWREDGSVVYNCCWASPAQSPLGPSPAGIMTMFTISNLRLLQSGRTGSLEQGSEVI